MSPDVPSWIAAELGLVLVEDSIEGGARIVAGPAVPGAASVAGRGGSLTELALALIGGDEAEGAAAIEELVEGARHGIQGRAGFRTPRGEAGLLLAWPAGAGRARVVIARDGRDGVTVRRAAAADLAAGVTHEIANALTAISGWTRLAASGQPLPERTKQALSVVQRSAREALGSARGLLRTMRDTGSPSIESSSEGSIDVAEIVDQVLDTLRPELDEAGISLEAELDRSIHATTPSTTIRLIVSNLARNAFEALERGGSIRVEVRPRGERFVLSVTDDGPGMSATTLTHAFDRYFTTKTSGTGLGLALVREAVEDAGGQVDVQSRRGVGTRFEIVLPRAGAAALSLRPPSVTALTSGVHPKPPLLQKRLLVVDDDEAMRTMVRTALEIQGAMVDVAFDRESALDRTWCYDVALVDLGLGADRGDTLIEELLAAGLARFAVLMTGSADAAPPQPGGPTAVLRKPFELEELHRVLEAVLLGDVREAEG